MEDKKEIYQKHHDNCTCTAKSIVVNDMPRYKHVGIIKKGNS